MYTIQLSSEHLFAASHATIHRVAERSTWWSGRQCTQLIGDYITRNM